MVKESNQTKVLRILRKSNLPLSVEQISMRSKLKKSGEKELTIQRVRNAIPDLRNRGLLEAIKEGPTIAKRRVPPVNRTKYTYNRKCKNRVDRVVGR